MFNDRFNATVDQNLSIQEINAINTTRKAEYTITTSVHLSRNFSKNHEGNRKKAADWVNVSNYTDLIENGKFELVLDKNGRVALNIKHVHCDFTIPFEES